MSRNGIVRRTIGRVKNLSDVTQGLIYFGAGLLGMAIVIVPIAYRAEIWRFFLLLFGAVLLALAVGGLGYGLSRMKINRDERIKSEATKRCAAEERLLWERQSGERQRAELLRAVSAGEIVPLSDSAGLFLRNSEALWYRCGGSALDRKGESHNGTLCITSLRILFISVDYPLEIPIGGVNATDVGEKGLNLIGKSTATTQNFLIDDPELAAAHVERSVKAYHRQVDIGFEVGAGRQIPQNVKTAVWQRDGGQCVECGATDYLEFDHIIPHAKGGASTVDNVQLLCRRCNLKKGAVL